MKTNLIIRPYQIEDCKHLCPLYAQLGYPVSVKGLEKRLSKLLTHDDYHFWIAAIDEYPVGFIGFARMYMFEADEDYIRILALVVDKDYRRKGIAAALIEKVKQFAKESGVESLALNSGITNERESAHLFYQNLGFEKSSFGFKCRLTSP